MGILTFGSGVFVGVSAAMIMIGILSFLTLTSGGRVGDPIIFIICVWVALPYHACTAFLFSNHAKITCLPLCVCAASTPIHPGEALSDLMRKSPPIMPPPPCCGLGCAVSSCARTTRAVPNTAPHNTSNPMPICKPRLISRFINFPSFLRTLAQSDMSSIVIPPCSVPAQASNPVPKRSIDANRTQNTPPHEVSAKLLSLLDKRRTENKTGMLIDKSDKSRPLRVRRTLGGTPFQTGVFNPRAGECTEFKRFLY